MLFTISGSLCHINKLLFLAPNEVRSQLHVTQINEDKGEVTFVCCEWWTHKTRNCSALPAHTSAFSPGNTLETGLASRRLKLLRCLVQYITYFIGHGDNFAFLVPLTEARKQFAEKNIITDRVCAYSIWKLKNKPFPGLLSDINLIYSPSCNTTCVVLMSWT